MKFDEWYISLSRHQRVIANEYITMASFSFQFVSPVKEYETEKEVSARLNWVANVCTGKKYAIGTYDGISYWAFELVYDAIEFKLKFGA